MTDEADRKGRLEAGRLLFARPFEFVKGCVRVDDLPAADRALVDGRIDEAQWQAIRRADQAGEVPSQNTPLGGMIGIHGIGDGDRGVHRDFNWTNGCVALTNEEIDELLRWVKIGTPVEIR